MKNGWRLFSAVIAAGCVCFAAKAEADGEQSSLTVKCTNAETEPIELAAVLIVPIDGDDNNTFGSSAEEDLYCDLVKVLGGLNTRPWAVTDGVDQKRGMMLILR